VPPALRFATPAVGVEVAAPDPVAQALATTFRTLPALGDGDPADVAVTVTAEGDGWRATEGDGTVHEGPTVPRLTSALVSRLNELHLAHDDGRAHVHAAGLTHERGAVLLVGHAGAGKSTLATHLVRRGYGYLTDEMLGVEPDGRVMGYAKPLTLKYGSRHLTHAVRDDLGLHTEPGDGQRWEVPADALGSVAATGPHTVASLILPRYDADHDRPPLAEALSPADALLALGANALDLDRSPATALLAFGHLAALPTHRLQHGDAEAAADWLDHLLAEPAVGPRCTVGLVTPPPAHPDRLGRRTLGVVLGDVAVVWHPERSRLAALNPEATALWRVLGDPGTEPEPGAGDFYRHLVRNGLAAGPVP
jgi:hypothetical protein